MARPQDNPYNAFITTGTVREKERGLLSPLRFGIKDNIDVSGLLTTAGSRILLDNIAESSAPLVDRILSEGGTVVGKTNMHEFAVGATTTSTAAGPCRNPLDRARICGGSSGGSAACVASGEADIGIGTDTGGSVRLPAALCGVIGFKPTAGSIQTEGIIPLSTTLDTVGVLGRDLGEIGLVFSTIAERGTVHMDWSGPERRIRIGLYRFGRDDVSGHLIQAVNRLRNDFDISVVEIPTLTRDGARVRRTVSSYEGARFHERWMNEHGEDYFPDVLSVLKGGSCVQDSVYADALEEMQSIREDFEEVMERYDVLLSPAVTERAPLISEVLGNEADYRRLLDITELFNTTGSPSLSFPVRAASGLPFGLLVSGASGQDAMVLGIAKKLMEHSSFSSAV